MNYMSAEFIGDVYNALQGELIDTASIPDVENLFVAGSPCEIAYAEMRCAYDRLLLRLKKQDDDRDIETIIGSLLTISRHLSCAMYLCGARFAIQSACKDFDINIQNDAS